LAKEQKPTGLLIFVSKSVFMTVATKFPVTLEDRLELGAGELRFPATLEEFADLLEVCEYPIEFQENEIIVMSIASDPHEQIVANFLYILGTIFKAVTAMFFFLNTRLPTLPMLR